MDYEPGSLLSEAFNSRGLKTTKNLWFPISEFVPDNYTYKPLMIAAPVLVAPITNPDGVSLAWYIPSNDEFMVSVLNFENMEFEKIKIHRSAVRYFILVEGPF